MPVVDHPHDWTQTAGGFLCQQGPCTAFFSPAELQANLTNAGSTRSNNVSTFNEMITRAFKKAGH